VNGEIPTQTEFNAHVRDNFRELWHRVAYVEFTTPVIATGGTHTEAAPIDIVSAGAITFTAEPIEIVFSAPLWDSNTGGASSGISLWDGTDLGRLAYAITGGNQTAGLRVSRFLTPTAASHTYKARAWRTAGGANATVHAGAGGAGTLMPGYIAIWQKGGS
jgi:hypothetical protein